MVQRLTACYIDVVSCESRSTVRHLQSAEDATVDYQYTYVDGDVMCCTSSPEPNLFSYKNVINNYTLFSNKFY